MHPSGAKTGVYLSADSDEKASAKAQPRLAGIFFTHSTHVEVVIQMTFCGDKRKQMGSTTRYCSLELKNEQKSG